MAAKDDRIQRLLAGDMMSAMIKKYGDNIVRRASEFSVEACPRIPTGIYPLDLALGGGFPVGRTNVIWGHKSGGKTTTILKTIAQAQRMCSTCFAFIEADACKCKKPRKMIAGYIDVEGTWDAPWAKQHGVDLDSLALSQPEFAEQALDLADGFVRSMLVDVVVIDSIAFMSPEKEVKASNMAEQMGVQARAVGKGVRKAFVSGLNAVALETGRRPTVFLTNQVRMKIGVMFGSPETTPGGMAPGFAATTETKCWAENKYEMDEATGRPISATMHFKIEKNKTSPAKMEGEYKMLLCNTETKKTGEVLDEGLMVEDAEKNGLIEKKGGDWVCMGEKFSAKSHIERKVMTEVAYKRKLRDALFTIMIPQLSC